MAKGAILGVETAAIAAAVLLILLQARINPAFLVLSAASEGPRTAAFEDPNGVTGLRLKDGFGPAGSWSRP